MFCVWRVSSAFEEDESLFAYARTDGEKKAVILANFGKEEMTVKFSENLGKVLLANYVPSATD